MDATRTRNAAAVGEIPKTIMDVRIPLYFLWFAFLGGGGQNSKLQWRQPCIIVVIIVIVIQAVAFLEILAC
jgi:hypothetical protein